MNKSKLIKIVLLIIILISMFYYILKNEVKQETALDNNEIKGKPVLTGWVAWWKEDPGYKMISAQKGSISEVSPFWFRLNNDLEYDQKGNLSKRTEIIDNLKKDKIKIYPTLSALFGDKNIHLLLNNSEKQKVLIDRLVTDLKSLKVDGLDLDFEGINKSDKSRFVTFVSDLKRELEKNKMVLVVTLQAQTGKNDPDVVKGQDLKSLGQVADEIRIMAYDKHGTFSGAGAITPNDWLKNVVIYCKSVVPDEKLVIGLPSYGYIWPINGPANGYQFDEFSLYIKESSESVKTIRDSDSGEMIYEGQTFTGYLSDAESIKQKMLLVRDLGINKFSIWNLGGMDESFFNFSW